MSNDIAHVYNQKGRQYDSVDLVKFIGSVMIFTMHGKAFGDNKYMLFAFELLTRWAVPFFFIVSSFFLEKKIQETPDCRTETVKNYCYRVFRLYLVWMLINIPSIIESRLIGKDITSWDTWLVFFKTSLFASTFKGSWYLSSSIFSSWLIYWVLRKYSLKKIIILTLPFELLCIITSIYSGLLPETIKKTLCNDLLFPLNIMGGVFLFAIGKSIYYYRFSIKLKKSIAVLLVCYSLFGCEVLAAKKIGFLGMTDYSIFLIPVAYIIAIISLYSNLRINSHLRLRKLSTIIYCCQGNVLFFATILSQVLGIQLYCIEYIFAAVLCFFTCILIMKLQNIKNTRVLKMLT